MAGPEPSIGSQPRIDLDEGCGAELVQSPLRVGAHVDQPGVAEHAEVLGYTGLAEFHQLDQFSDRAFTDTEEIQNFSSGGVRQNLEDVCHASYITQSLYNCKAIVGT